MKLLLVSLLLASAGLVHADDHHYYQGDRTPHYVQGNQFHSGYFESRPVTPNSLSGMAAKNPNDRYFYHPIPRPGGCPGSYCGGGPTPARGPRPR